MQAAYLSVRKQQVDRPPPFLQMPLLLSLHTSSDVANEKRNFYGVSSGFHSVGLSQHPILVAIQKVAQAGYKAIELNAETLPWAKPPRNTSNSCHGTRRYRRRSSSPGLVH